MDSDFSKTCCNNQSKWLKIFNKNAVKHLVTVQTVCKVFRSLRIMPVSIGV